MKKNNREEKRRLLLNKKNIQANEGIFARPDGNAHFLKAGKDGTARLPLNKRLIAIILAIVMVVGLIPAGMFMLRPKAEGENLDAVDMIVRVNNEYYGTVSIPSGQIKDNIASITDNLNLPDGCTFERAVMEDSSSSPPTVSTIAAVGTYNDNTYYSLDADTNTGTLLGNKQHLILLYSDTYTITKTATNGSIDCDDTIRNGNNLHVALTPDRDHSVSPEDVTYIINGTEYHPSVINNNSFTISAAEITNDVEIEVVFPAITEYTIQDAHQIQNATSKYYNLYGEDGHGGITQGRGQSAAGNPSDNHRSVFKDYTYNLITPSATNEMRNNPKYLNWKTDSLDFSDSSYPNLYETLGYTNITTNSNGVITDVQPNNAVAGQPAEFLLYSQSWSGNTSWILDSLSINGEYINYPTQTEIADPNNKPSATTTLTKGEMAGTVVTVTLDEIGTGLYWKSLNSSGSFDPDVTYKHSTSNQKTYTNGGNSAVLDIWQLNSHAKKRTYYKITLSEVHENVEVAYNFKDSSERTIVITDLEGIESAFAAQEHRGTIGFNPYSRFYSVPMDRNENLTLDVHNEYPAYYQEHYNLLPRVPSANLYLYQVKPGYNPYTVEATAKYYHTDGTPPTVIESTDSNQKLLLADGGGLPGDVIHNATQKNMEELIADWPDILKPFAERVYDYDSPIRYWGGSNSDGADYNLVNKSTKGKQIDWKDLNSNIPLLLESIKDYENIVKSSKTNYKIYAIGLLENEAMTQELKLKANPFEYTVLFDLNGGTYNSVPNGLITTDSANIYTRGANGQATVYTLENGPLSTRMPKGEQPIWDNHIFLGWKLYKDGVAVTDEGYDKTYSSNEAFAINEKTIAYADYHNDAKRNVPTDTGHTFTFKAEWIDKAQSNDYATVNIIAQRQDLPNGEYESDYTTYYDEIETQLIGDAVLLNRHDSKAELGNGTYDPKYYILNTELSQLSDNITKNGDNTLRVVYDLALYDLDVSKKVIGSPKTTKVFPITIVLTRDQDSPVSFAEAKTLIKPSISSITGTADDATETITYTYNFKRSQNLTFADVPYGWSVVVSEPYATEKPNTTDGTLDYTTTIASVPETAGSQQQAQDGDTATVWEGVLTEDTAVTVTNRSDSFLDLTKTLKHGDDGKYDLRLTAYANGSITKEAEVITEQVPTDYILVVDQSGSMAYKDMPLDYVLAADKSWKLSDIPQSHNTDQASSDKAYYYRDKNTGEYYRVYKKWGNMYEYVPRNSTYVEEVINTNGLGWFKQATDQERPFYSTYYYRPAADPYIDLLDPTVAQDNHFYPITITVANAALHYKIKFTYQDINGATRTVFGYNDPTDYDPNDMSAGKAVYYNNPLNNSVYGPSNALYNPINNVVVRAARGTSMAAALALVGVTADKGPFPNYTYAEIGSPVNVDTGMYIQNPLFIGHVGYNALCYKDSFGVEHKLISTDYCDSDGIPLDSEQGSEVTWDGKLYEIAMDGQGNPQTTTRLAVLNEALHNFVANVASQTDDNGTVDHRIAIVGFSSENTQNHAYDNNEILSGVSITNTNGSSEWSNPETSPYSLDGKIHNGALLKDGISADTYYGSLVRTNTQDGVDSLDESVDALTAYGGTQPEIGLQMAKSIIEERDNREGSETGRHTVVIFFTDGRPGNYSNSNQYNEANDVVDAASDIKSLGATVYSIGMFNEADGNPLTYAKYTENYVTYDQTDTEDDWRISTASNYSSYSKTRDEDRLRHSFENGYVRVEDGKQKNDTASTQEYKWHLIGGYSWDSSTRRADVTVVEGEQFFYRKSLLNTYGYPEQQNDTISDYMSVVSSEYPQATLFDPTVGNNQTYNGQCVHVRGESVKQNNLNRYYYNATNGDGLDKVFNTIASEIPGSNTVITLDAENSVLRDVINGDDFEIPISKNDLRIRAWTEECVVTKEGNTEMIPDNDSDAWHKVADIDDDDIHYENGVINVQGFDYATNYVGYDNTDHKGQRIVVEIEGLVPKKDAVGELESNVDTSGVYKLSDSGEVLLDAFDVPNLYRYAYRLKETGVKTDDSFDIEIAKETAPEGILVPYDKDSRSTHPLSYDSQNNTVVWNNAKTEDSIFFESLHSDRVELKAEVPSDDLNQDDLTYSVFWQNEEKGFDTEFGMYKPNQTIEDSTILVHNVTNYRDLTIALSADESPYVAPGYDFTVEVQLTGSKLTEKIDALNEANSGTGVVFTADGSKLKATITMPMKEDGSIDPVQFKIPDGVEVDIDHSDYFYTTDEPYKYHDETMENPETKVDYTPHVINTATTIYIHDTLKEVIETGVMDEGSGSHVIGYVIGAMAVISGGAGAAYVYRKKDEFIEQ